MEIAQLILSNGIYGLLKNHLSTNSKLTSFNRTRLEREIKHAEVVSSDVIPDDVVSINRQIRIIDVESGQTFEFELVNPADASMKNNKVSVLSPVGVAIVGYREGDAVQWEMPGGLKTYRIEKVEVQEPVKVS